jgi:hypothetical protein
MTPQKPTAEPPLPAAKEVIRLLPDQFETASVTLSRAFENYPLMIYAFPNVEGRLRAVKAVYDPILWDCLRWGEVYATSDLSGVACWLPPGQTYPSLMRLIRCGMLMVPFHFGWTGFRRLLAYDSVAQKLHHEQPPAQHWYLWAIGVRPEDQGKGIAGQITAPILARADRERLPCYLETHVEANVRVYSRLGFETAAKTDLPKHPLPVWGMVRSPRVRASIGC